MKSILLPVASLEILIWIPVISGILGGLTSSMIAIGGGIMMGVPSQVAIVSQLNNAIGTGLGSLIGFIQRRDVDIGLAWYIFIGGVLGAVLEFTILRWIKTYSGELATTKIFIVGVLTLLSIMMLSQTIGSFSIKPTQSIKGASMRHWMIYFPWHRIFIRSRVEMSIIVPIGVGIITGLATSTLGGATSLFIAPMLTYLIGRVTPSILGTTSFSGLGITITVALLHAVNENLGDFVLIFILIIGGSIGTLIGQLLIRYIPKRYLSLTGAIVIFMICAKLWFSLYKQNWMNPLTKILPPVSVEWFEHMMGILELYPDQRWMMQIIEFIRDNPFEYAILCLILSAVISVLLQMVLQKLFLKPSA